MERRAIRPENSGAQLLGHFERSFRFSELLLFMTFLCIRKALKVLHNLRLQAANCKFDRPDTYLSRWTKL